MKAGTKLYSEKQISESFFQFCAENNLSFTHFKLPEPAMVIGEEPYGYILDGTFRTHEDKLNLITCGMRESDFTHLWKHPAKAGIDSDAYYAGYFRLFIRENHLISKWEQFIKTTKTEE